MKKTTLSFDVFNLKNTFLLHGLLLIVCFFLFIYFLQFNMQRLTLYKGV